MKEEKYIDYEGLTRYDQLLKSKIGVEADAGHEYVEIAGIKWATMNVGANSITDTGLYFQWGDTQGYTASQVGSGEGQKYFGWADYKYNPSGDEETFTKYNSTDGKTVLDASDDAVTANWGGQWRMPTVSEWQTLEYAINDDYVTSAWTSDYQGSGVPGITLTDASDSSKVLFFPAAGYCDKGSVDSIGSYGHYLSSSLYTYHGNFSAYDMYFDRKYVNWDSNSFRYYGYLVRGIYTGDKTSGTVGKVLGTTILDSERTKWNNAVNNCITSTTSGLKIEVVQALPANPDSNTIYIVQ